MSGRLLEGLRVGLLVRNSTVRQVGNWRALDQEDRLLDLIKREGGTPVLYDEQATSGRDLSKRKVALGLLDDIKTGALQAVGAWDIKRLTRDEFGGDAGLIAKQLAKRKAPLVTVDRVYRLWDDRDLFQYRIDTAISGNDVTGTRATFWDGVFSRAARLPFFMGTPPIGYYGRLVEVPAADGDRSKVRRLPAKCAEHAALMADLRRWLDEYDTLGDIVRLVNLHHQATLGQRGHQRNRRYGKVWAVETVRYLIRNPVYWGRFEFGRTVDRQNVVWDKDSRRARRAAFYHIVDGETPCPCGNDHGDLGDLRYWTREDAERWQRKFAFPYDQPAKRSRTYPHHLRGVLACPGCGHAMVAWGRCGYQCAAGRAGQCAAPQGISEPNAFRALETILPGVLERLGDHIRAGVATILTDGPGGAAATVRGERGILVEKLEVMTEQWYGPEAPARVPDPVLREMSELQQRIDRAEQQAAGLEAERATTGEARAAAERIASGGVARFVRLPVAQQGALYRGLLRGVRVKGEGAGGARRHAVLPGWEEPLLGRLLGADTASDALAYIATALQKAA